MSFRWKLLGALTLVAILAAVGTYFLTARAVGERFAAYRLQERQVAGQQLARLLGQFWEARGAGPAWTNSSAPAWMSSSCARAGLSP